MSRIVIIIREDGAHTVVNREFDSLNLADVPEVVLQALQGAGFQIQGVAIDTGLDMLATDGFDPARDDATPFPYMLDIEADEQEPTYGDDDHYEGPGVEPAEPARCFQIGDFVVPSKFLGRGPHFICRVMKMHAPTGGLTLWSPEISGVYLPEEIAGGTYPAPDWHRATVQAEEEPTTARTEPTGHNFKIRQRYRVTKPYAEVGADVEVGDVVVVTDLWHDGSCQAKTERDGDNWYYNRGSALELIQEEPVASEAPQDGPEVLPTGEIVDSEDPRWVIRLTPEEYVETINVLEASTSAARQDNAAVYGVYHDRLHIPRADFLPTVEEIVAYGIAAFSYTRDQAQAIYNVAVADNPGSTVQMSPEEKSRLRRARIDNDRFYAVLGRLVSCVKVDTYE